MIGTCAWLFFEDHGLSIKVRRLATSSKSRNIMGHTVLGKTICENYKTKKRHKVKPEKLMIFRNTYETIVDEET